MKVSITRGGGLAGITTQTELASEALPPAAARELEELAKAVAPAKEAPTSHPDELHYRLTVGDGDSITVDYSDGTLPEDVGRLIAWVDQRPERREEIQGPG